MADRAHRTPLSAADRDHQLRDLVTTLRGPLIAYAGRLTAGDMGFAEDVVQEAFLRAWTNMELLTSRRGSVRGWLRRVVHNLVMDGYRRRAARPSEVDLAHAEMAAIPDPMADVLNALLVEQVLRGLWPQHRSALVDVYLNDHTAAEVAAALGVPVGTVKSRVYYAVRAARASAPNPTDCQRL